MRRSLVLGAVLLVFVSLLAPQATAATSTRAYIVVLNDSVTDPAAVASQHGHAYGFVAKFVYGHALKGYAAPLSSSAAQAIAADPRVAFLEPDTPVGGVALLGCFESPPECLAWLRKA